LIHYQQHQTQEINKALQRLLRRLLKNSGHSSSSSDW
jgi:hypothetical protein